MHYSHVKKRRENFGSGQKKAKTVGNPVEYEEENVDPNNVAPVRRTRSLSRGIPIPNQTAFVSSEKKRGHHHSSTAKLFHVPATPMKRTPSEELQTQFERAQHEIHQMFEIHNKISETKTSVIYRAVDRLTGSVCVIKHLNDRYVRTPDKQRVALLEYQNAALLKPHPHIVSYDWYLQSGPFIYFRIEYCPMGSLASYLEENRLYDETTRQEKDILWNFLLDLLIGLAWIHNRGFLHLDIKPANVFLVPSNSSSSSSNGGSENIPTLKIGDFGLSRKKGNHSRNSSSKIGKKKKGDGRYLAPEFLQDTAAVTEKADMYSLGITLYEMAMDFAPSAELWAEIRSGIIKADSLSTELSQMIKSMLSQCPSDRPSAHELLLLTPRLSAKAAEVGVSSSLLSLFQPDTDLSSMDSSMGGGGGGPGEEGGGGVDGDGEEGGEGGVLGGGIVRVEGEGWRDSLGEDEGSSFHPGECPDVEEGVEPVEQLLMEYVPPPQQQQPPPQLHQQKHFESVKKKLF